MPKINLSIWNSTFLKGNWGIQASANPPAEGAQSVLLQVGQDGPCLDITAGYTADHMVGLLEILAVGKLWSQFVSCRALLVEPGDKTLVVFEVQTYSGMTRVVSKAVPMKVLAQSGAVSLKTPVEPLVPNPSPMTYGRMALLPIGTSTPRAPYIWEWATNPTTGAQYKAGRGRTLTPPINGRYYFINKNNLDALLENDITKRGFDCTSYIVSAYNKAYAYTGGDGSEVATILGARNTGVNDRKGKDLFQYFRSAPTPGEYVMWISNEHVVLLNAGFVHEYTTGDVHGYACTPLLVWLESHENKSINIWPMPGTPDLTVPATSTQGISIGVPGGVGIGAPAGNLPPTSTNGGGSAYTVVKGDSLSLISGRFWGDVLLWPLLYDANRAVVGSDPNKIYPGQKLTVPAKSGYTQAQISSARSRGAVC